MFYKCGIPDLNFTLSALSIGKRHGEITFSLRTEEGRNVYIVPIASMYRSTVPSPYSDPYQNSVLDENLFYPSAIIPILLVIKSLHEILKKINSFGNIVQNNVHFKLGIVRRRFQKLYFCVMHAVFYLVDFFLVM